MSERRQSPRHVPDEERFGRVKATVPARIVDISREGAQLEVPAALRPAVECDLALPAGGGLIRLRARVLRCRAIPTGSHSGEHGLVFRAGLQFLDVSDETVHALEREYGLPVDEKGDRPTPAQAKARRGPIKIQVDSAAIRRRMRDED